MKQRVSRLESFRENAGRHTYGRIGYSRCQTGDIGNTSALYARALFDHYGADAVTLNPYMGFDSLELFCSIPISCLSSSA